MCHTATRQHIHQTSYRGTGTKHTCGNLSLSLSLSLYTHIYIYIYIYTYIHVTSVRQRTKRRSETRRFREAAGMRVGGGRGQPRFVLQPEVESYPFCAARRSSCCFCVGTVVCKLFMTIDGQLGQILTLGLRTHLFGSTDLSEVPNLGAPSSSPPRAAAGLGAGLNAYYICYHDYYIYIYIYILLVCSYI